MVRDVVIAGGGPVGSALAIALGQAGFDVLLLEAREGLPDDRRSLALAYGSRLILERLGAWPALRDATPIETIHVSQRGAPGRALLTAREAGRPALGYVAGYAELQRSLACLAQTTPGVEVRRGARATTLRGGDAQATLAYEQDGAAREVSARLVALADGGALAQSVGPQRTRDYGQCALVATVRTDRPHDRRAFERFTPQGPIALLPFRDAYSLVWTTNPAQAQALTAAAHDALPTQLQEAFGDRAGRFVAVEGCASFPLVLRVATAPGAPRTLLVGNAAQTLHPVAGQGLNLGLRDAWDLAQRAAEAREQIGEAAFVRRYVAARAPDRRTTVLLTDSLVRLFSQRTSALGALRGCGLAALDSSRGLKRAFMHQMMFGA
jgi:2-octaprenyl-6-methoxyphenol hydroxylase